MAQFKEVARFMVNEARDIVASQVIENGVVKGYNINSYIRTAKYTGFAAGGCFVPTDKLPEFVKFVKKMVAN